MHQCKSLLVAQLSVPSTELRIFWAEKGLGPLFLWVILVYSPPTHLVMSGGTFSHLSLIWVLITQSWHLQCSQVCTVLRLHLQQWTPLASHSSNLWLFSTCPWAFSCQAAQTSTTWEILTHYQVWLPAWEATFATTKPELLLTYTEELLLRRY